jgi:hypothetical protein
MFYIQPLDPKRSFKGGLMSIHDHSVQFYHDDTFFTESVASFIREGLKGNSTVIIVATAHHRAELHKVLTFQETNHDKLRFLDAGVLLSTFMVDGMPDELLFKNVIGGMVGEASKDGPVRVFGEMVALLWAKGDTRAALCLEELWNWLMEKQSFALLCAYPIANLSSEEGHDSMPVISRLHSHSHAQGPSFVPKAE